MENEEIRKIAREKVNEYTTLTDKAQVSSIDLKYVKLIDNREKPDDVTIKKAWVVRFVDDGKYKDFWIELALDDNGEILKVEQSR